MYLRQEEFRGTDEFNASSFMEKPMQQRLPSSEKETESGQRVLATLVNRIVAASFGLDAEELLSSDRGTAKVARARQITVYLLHTGLSIKMADVARFFSRDRTTIGYACRTVEDLRDKPLFDKQVRDYEEIIELVRELCCADNQDNANA